MFIILRLLHTEQDRGKNTLDQLLAWRGEEPWNTHSHTPRHAIPLCTIVSQPYGSCPQVLVIAYWNVPSYEWTFASLAVTIVIENVNVIESFRPTPSKPPNGTLLKYSPYIHLLFFSVFNARVCYLYIFFLLKVIHFLYFMHAWMNIYYTVSHKSEYSTQISATILVYLKRQYYRNESWVYFRVVSVLLV